MIKHFVKILESLGDLLEVCVSVYIQYAVIEYGLMIWESIWASMGVSVLLTNT